MNQPGSERMRIIIVGGSVAGIVLAHCLERAGIDYIILEKNVDLAPQLGASIGIMPNGAQILDQLGLYDAVEAQIEPLRTSRCSTYPKHQGFLSHYPTMLWKKFNYPLSFLERKVFLEIIYRALPDKSKVLIGKKVVGMDRIDDRYRVHTSDGSSYDGDLVVGADGVHSKVRSMMWDLANAANAGFITNIEKDSMRVDYTCVYGMSRNLKFPVCTQGNQLTAMYDGMTIVTAPGLAGRTFWFVVWKLDKQYTYPAVPKYSKEECHAVCEEYKDYEVAPGFTFENLWSTCYAYSMAALEESVFEHWAYERIVCIGDSMHKATPTLGQGANIAIEEAAALTNELHKIAGQELKRPEMLKKLEEMLQVFNATRKPRAKELVSAGGMITRLQARDGKLFRLITRWILPIMPYIADVPSLLAGGSIIGGGCIIDFLPKPPRAYGKKVTHHTFVISSTLALVGKVVLGLVLITILGSAFQDTDLGVRGMFLRFLAFSSYLGILGYALMPHLTSEHGLGKKGKFTLF